MYLLLDGRNEDETQRGDVDHMHWLYDEDPDLRAFKDVDPITRHRANLMELTAEEGVVLTRPTYRVSVVEMWGDMPD